MRMDLAEQSRPHAIVYGVVKDLLLASAETEEIRMSIGAVARFFAVSRSPAERALNMLADEGVLQRRANGKFTRPPLSPRGEPRMVSIEDLVRDPPHEIPGIGRQRGSWLQLYDQVAQMVAGVTNDLQHDLALFGQS